MSKVKVSPAQMEFWKDFYEGGKVEVLKRLTKEFNMGLTAASEVYNNFPSSFHIVDTPNNASQKHRTFLPSHSSDNRVPVFLKQQSFDYIEDEMRQALGGDPYEHFMQISPEIREKVFNRVMEELVGVESQDQLSIVRTQYPFGVYPISDSRLETVDQIKQVLEEGLGSSHNSRAIPTVISDFLSSITYWEEEKQVTSYIAIAEFLYNHASEKIKEMKTRPDPPSDT